MEEHKDPNIPRETVPEMDQPKNLYGRWASFFIERYRIVYLLIVAVIVVGLSSYFTLPRELQPEITLPYGRVLTLYTGAAPVEVETLVTNKIEAQMDSVEDVKTLTSYSGFGYSLVWLEFEQGVDMEKKVTEMREALSGIQSEIPDAAEIPSVSSIKTNNSPIMILNVSGEYDLVQLTRMAKDIKDRLESDPSVLEALVIGGVDREIRIQVDPQKLAAYQVSMDTIKNALAAANVNFPGGTLVLDERNYNLRTVGELQDPKQLENIVIAKGDGGALYLKDVATVVDGYADEESYSRMATDSGGKGEMLRSVAISVKKKTTADIIRTSDQIHKIITDEKGTLYPEDLSVKVSGDTAEYVRDQLGSVIGNSLSGLCLVMVVLFLFIGFSEAILVSIVIPLTLLVTLWFMKASDLTLNNITLFSMILAVGMLVDDAIVIMQNIDRLRFKGISAIPAAEAATNQIAPAVASATLTTVASFFPLMLTSGIMGAYIKSIPLTVIYAMTASFFVAMTVTPALSALVLKKHRSEIQVDPKALKTRLKRIGAILLVTALAIYAFSDDNQIHGFSIFFGLLFSGLMIIKIYKYNDVAENYGFIKWYAKVLDKFIYSRRNRRILVGVLCVAFLAAVSLLPLGILKVEMFGGEDQTRLYINVETPKGTPIETTDSIVKEVEKLVLPYPELDTFVSNVGITGADSFDDMGGGTGGGNPTIGRLVIDLKPEEERTRSSMDIAEELRAKVKTIAGAKVTVQELENGPPSSSPFAVTLQGKNLDELKQVAQDFMAIAEEMPGTMDVDSTVAEGDPELQIQVDKEQAARLGLNDYTVALTIRNAVNGLEATKYRVNQDEIDVKIYLEKGALTTKADLEKLYVYNTAGLPVQLGQVARIVEDRGYTTITHEARKREVSVTSQVQKGFLGNELTTAFKEKVASYPLPEGVTVKYGGEAEDIQDSFGDMITNMVVAILLVFIIVAVQFNSLSQPMLILSALPLGLIGVFPGLVLTGHTFNFTAFIGVVALVGIAVKNGIVLIDYINYLRREGHDLYEATRITGTTRFIPVIATTITAVGGIIPITLKQPFFAGLGYTLIFGLSVSTVLTLLFIPSMYIMLEERKIRKDEKRMLKAGGNEHA